MITKSDLTIENLGEWLHVSARVNGDLVKRKYQGYSRRQAIARFLQAVN